MSTDLPYKLRKIRQMFGLTYAELAKELRDYGAKVSAEMVRQFEDGTDDPSEAVLLAYSKVSHFPVDSLTNDEIKPFLEQASH